MIWISPPAPFSCAERIVEDLGLQDVAAENGEVRGRRSRLGLLHHAVDGEHPAIAFTGKADHAVILCLVFGYGLHRDDVAAMRGIGVEHLRKAAFALGLHQHVGKEECERLVADQLARAPNRMA